MPQKTNKNKIKHQLFHSFISLATVLIGVTYMKNHFSWDQVCNFWSSFLIPIVLFGEILKVILVHYYERLDDSPILHQRKKNGFTINGGEFFNGLFIQALCTLFFAFFCIILGAPVLYRYEETLKLAVLLTLFTVTPSVFLLGSNGALEICFCENTDVLTNTENTAIKLYRYNAVGALLGAWIGSIVAPLDWDVKWQTYPIPNVIGALLGSSFANIYVCLKMLYNELHDLCSKKRA